MTYLIIGTILAIGSAGYLTSCNIRSGTSDKQTTIAKDTTKQDAIQENTFEGMRKMALSVTADQLGLVLSSDNTIVYGVIMDWGMNEGIATVVSYQTGDASLYISSGGGVIGGGQHKNVNIAAKQFVSKAQACLHHAIKTDSTTLPIANEVKFYLLTNKGVFTGKEQMKNFENNSSYWLELFQEGNNVLTELRKQAKNQ